MAEKVDYADVVARVMVERIERPAEDNSSTSDPATYTFRPTHVWKGDVADVFTVSSAVSGASCGLEGIFEGDDVVLFASEGTDGILPQDIAGLTANLCGGTALVDEALLSEVSDVLGEGTAGDVAPTEGPRTAGRSVGLWWGIGAGGVVLLLVALWFVVRAGRRQV